ncbi:MAG: GNAT family N-acetyltransferase [Bacteroidota bacterium]
MEVKQDDNGGKGSFYLGESADKKAEMTYTWAGNDRIIIDHTEVSDELRGTGAGKQMVEQAVAFARDKKISIIPLCPFAKSVFDKRQDLRDVL